MQERLFSVSLTWVREEYLGEVAGDVVLVVLYLAQHVEEEDAHVLVQVLVVQEQLRQEGQVLAVNRVLVAIYLEDRDGVLLVAVDFVAGRVEEGTGLGVAAEFYFESKEAEAEVADVEAVEVVVVDRVGAEVPASRREYQASVACLPSCRRKTVLNLVISWWASSLALFMPKWGLSLGCMCVLFSSPAPSSMRWPVRRMREKGTQSSLRLSRSSKWT